MPGRGGAGCLRDLPLNDPAEAGLGSRAYGLVGVVGGQSLGSSHIHSQLP